MKSTKAILSGRSAEAERDARQPSPASTWHTTDPDDLYVMSNDPAAAGHNPPDPVPCEHCGKQRHTEGFWLCGSIKWKPWPELCDCPEAVAAYEKAEAEREAEERAEREREESMKMRIRVREIIGNSGMSARFLRRTFDTFQIAEQNQRAFRACKRYADNFREKLPRNDADPGRNGLFITGPKGTGKTHLAASVANQIMKEGTAVICMTMIDMLDRIKQTYEKQRQWGASENSVLNTYKEVPLLIIDDAGKEPATEWAVSKIYAIINARYEACLPTIITTNYTDSELVRRLTPKETGDATTADATIDRLREMCAAIATTGDSWRSR